MLPAADEIKKGNIPGNPTRGEVKAFDNVEARLKETFKVEPEVKLTDEAEALLSLDSLNETMRATLEDGFTATKTLKTSTNLYQQADALKTTWEDNRNKQLEQIGEKEKALLDRFDSDDDTFKESFKEKTGIDSNDKAREKLKERLEAERKRVENQRKQVDDVLNAMKAFANWQSRMMSAAKATELRTGDDMQVRTASGEIPKIEPGTFQPSKENFNLMRAFFQDDWSGTLMTIRADGSATFIPKDPAARDFIVHNFRSRGSKAVEIKLGTGVSEEYNQFGMMNPKHHRGLNQVAIEFTAKLKYGMNDAVINDYKYTKDYLEDFFDKHGTIPEELKDLVDPLPHLVDEVSIPNFQQTGAVKKEFARYTEVRTTLLELSIKMSQSAEQTESLEQALEDALHWKETGKLTQAPGPK